MKRSTTVLISVTAIAIVAIAFSVFFNRENIKPSDVKVAGADSVSLPDISSIDPDKTPLLYDFVNGSLGYKYKTSDFTDFGIYYAVAKNKNSKNEIFVSYYNYAERVIFPILGTIPTKETEFDPTILDTWTKTIDLSRVYSEGDWSIYIVSLYKNDDSETSYNYCDPSGSWAGLKLEKYNGDPGIMYNKVNNGSLGWPTEWLRRQPFHESVMEFGINIDDKFFDSNNLYSTIKYKNDHGGYLNVKIVQLERYQFKWNGETQEIDYIQNLKQFLKEVNYK